MQDVIAEVTGTIWKIECQVGDEIAEGDTLMILESMKMEIPVEADVAGTVLELRFNEGESVMDGDTLLVIS
jgi:acetyl-CoA carboxylase biotin carboxyl carrier protein